MTVPLFFAAATQPFFERCLAYGRGTLVVGTQLSVTCLILSFCPGLCINMVAVTLWFWHETPGRTFPWLVAFPCSLGVDFLLGLPYGASYTLLLYIAIGQHLANDHYPYRGLPLSVFLFAVAYTLGNCLQTGVISLVKGHSLMMGGLTSWLFWASTLGTILAYPLWISLSHRLSKKLQRWFSSMVPGGDPL